MTAVPSAPPSAGSVPAPTSSSRTSAGSRQVAVHRHHVGDVGREGAEAGGDRLLVADVREHRLEDRQASNPLSTGRCSPACAIATNRPAVLSATVLPPVFGPVITRTRSGAVSTMSTGTGSVRRRRSRSAVVLQPLVAPARSSAADAGRREARSCRRGDRPARCRRPSCEKRARAWMTSSSVATSTVRFRSCGRPRKLSVSASRMRRTSSASCSSSATMSLLISIVSSGST